MMKKKMICISLLCAMTMLLLTGCGDGSEEGTGLVQEALTVNSEPLLSETERAIYDYELKYNTGTFEMQDYHALADLYREVGKIRKQRDMLEQSYRLYDDAEALEKLQSITVNLAEEDEAIVQEAELMLQNLELPEYLDESVNMIVNSSWVRTMMPKLAAGSRNYFLQRDGQTILTIQVGYDEAGLPYSNVWYVNADNQLTLLQYVHTTVKVLQTTLADSAYDGPFELWTVDGSTGTILHQQGSFAKDLYTGDYTSSIHVGTESSDLFALWCNRQGMEYVVYTGHFDEQGKTTLAQPDADNQAALIAGSEKKACIVYAYDESGQNCLFLGLDEGVEPAAYAFDLNFMGVEAYPLLEVYEVEPVGDDAEGESAQQNAVSGGSAGQSDSETIQIRVFDGEIQYFNGYRWVSAGNVEEMAKADPFRDYAEKKEAYQNSLWGTVNDEESGNLGDVDNNSGASGNGDGTGVNAGSNLGIGAITSTPTPAPTSTPTPTKKPMTSNAGTTTTPKPTTTPTPSTPTPSTPEPDNDDDDDNSSSSGSTSTPTPSTPTPSTPTPSTPTPSTPTPSTPTPSTPTPSTPEPEPPTDDGGDDGGDSDSGDGEDMDWSDTVM